MLSSSRCGSIRLLLKWNAIGNLYGAKETGMFFNLIWVAAIILNIFALTDVMRSNRDTASKIVLMVLIILFPFFAAGIYLLVFRNKHAY